MKPYLVKALRKHLPLLVDEDTHPREVLLAPTITAQTLLKHGYVAHKIVHRGFVKNFKWGRFHAIYNGSRWAIHCDRKDKHEAWRYIRPSKLRSLAREVKILTR